MRGWVVVAVALAVGAAPARVDASEPDEVALLEMQRDGVPVVELYTMGQGDVLFQKFGHAALCLRYAERPYQDVCFNYGTTDFDSPIPLTWGFVRGTARFWVSLTTPEAMLDFYRALDRDIFLQPIPLADDQARAAGDRLLSDARPENRYYRYHHFYDNCTTRVRDILDAATGGALSRDADRSTGRSFRSYGRQGFAEQKWIIILSDLFMGRSSDRDATVYDAMFLPRVLREQVTERLGVAPEVIERRTGRPFSQDDGSGRGWIVLFGVLFAAPLVASRLFGRFERAGVVVAVVPLVFLGTLTWFFAVASTIPELRWNEVVVVFMPLDLMLVTGSAARRLLYARIRVAELALASLLLAAGVFVQPLWAPIAAAMLPLMAFALPVPKLGQRGQ